MQPDAPGLDHPAQDHPAPEHPTLDAPELRVVGCLVEKQLATPDHYPLTQNALVAACNQLSNRQPVVAYDDDTVRLAFNRLRTKGLVRLVHTSGARVPKHRHVLDEALELDRPALALLCVLALRGPQTAGELRARTERLASFPDLPAVEEGLSVLAGRTPPLVRRLAPHPGQKEVRYAQTLGGDEDGGPTATAPPPTAGVPAASRAGPPPEPGAPWSRPPADGLASLEARVQALEAGMLELRRALGLEEGSRPDEAPEEIG